MKNIQKMLMGFVLAITVYSCSVSKEASSMKQKINGNWMLETITTEGINGKVTATIFNETLFNCFVGSSWNFESNNSSGNYHINASGTECSAITRQIRWSVYEPKGAEKQFQFKRLDDKKHDLDNGDGFRLEIALLSATSMQLKSHITFEGKPAAYTYNFVKK
ncbi:MAG: lipocalin family protein [Ferruginibacter sp.]|nr:lipocalin family protein [Ferruginibacter sp.]